MNQEQKWLEAEIATARRQLETSVKTVKARAPFALKTCVQSRPYLSVGVAAALGFAAVALSGGSSKGAKKTPWSRIALRGTRLLGTLLPGLIGATAIVKQTEHENGSP